MEAPRSDLHGDGDPSRLDFGAMKFGCKHYRRRCKIRAPCCNEIFFCRHCHNESVADRHELHRHDVAKVICLICDEEQTPSQVCSNCGVKMGNYFCQKCNFYDDDTEKGQYHCDDCGICRVGGRENFFHCEKCGACYSIELRNKHLCVENSMRHNCPVCYEYLFDSMQETRVLKCGHTMHSDCVDDMLLHRRYACPICLKSMVDLSSYWRKLDEEVAATSMPSDYLNRKVWILCNDCNTTSEVVFHIVGQKCEQCLSYNTRTVAAPTIPQCYPLH